MNKFKNKYILIFFIGIIIPENTSKKLRTRSTERIAKGDFIRMKEISLNYDFPKSLANRMKLSNLSLKLQATNLFLIYADKKLNGQDPEFFNTGGVAAPVPKQFTLTLRLGI
jgi:hypothetical protein